MKENERMNVGDPDARKVIEMLTPRHQRKDTGWKKNFGRRRITRLMAIGGSIAAMVIFVVAMALHSGLMATAAPMPASELVAEALKSGAEAGNCRADFRWRGSRSTADEIYTPAADAAMVDGTIYFSKLGDRPVCRIDWHDAERNSIVYTGSAYVHLRDGKELSRHPSHSGLELAALLNLNSLTGMLGGFRENEISESGDLIKVSHRKNDRISFRAEFSRKNKQLTKAMVLAEANDGTEAIVMMETTSIAFGVEIPQSLFNY